MTNLTKLTLPALLLVAAPVAGGCSGTALETAAGPGVDPPVDGAREAEDHEVDDAEWSSPINDALGEAGESLDDAEHRARHLAVEDLTVVCMAEQGFAYHPKPLLTEAERARSDLAPDEFATTYGFGITTAETRSDSDDAVEDPNAAMIAEMTPAEQDAWHIALWGSAPVPVPSDADAAPQEQPETGGCADAAIAEVHGEDDYDREAAAAFDPLLAEISSVYDQIRRDPRVEAAAEAYAGCMADAGHPGYSVDGDDGAPSPTEAVVDRLHAAAAATVSADPDTTGSGKTLAGGGEVADIPADDLAEVRAFEIELAVADRPCRDAYERVRREVTFEHETRWVEANRAELEAYRAAVHGEEAR